MHRRAFRYAGYKKHAACYIARSWVTRQKCAKGPCVFLMPIQRVDRGLSAPGDQKGDAHDFYEAR